jgi:predicted ArsR family transcriptional regulator
MADTDREISTVAVLKEPVRRTLYRYIVERGEEVTRDQAAEAVGISRALAVFHLDRLAEEGLLDVSFRRLGSRRGPGSGRPSKLYRRSSRQVTINLPPRSYELAAQLMVAAIEDAKSPETVSVLADIARKFGENLGREAREHAGSEHDTAALLSAAQEVLSDYGFEPCTEADGRIRLRNCPFHALAERHRELVCGMNVELMRGLVDGLPVGGIEAVLDPQPGMCCVSFGPITLPS